MSDAPGGSRAYHIKSGESKVGSCHKQNEVDHYERPVTSTKALECKRAAGLGRRLSAIAYVHRAALSTSTYIARCLVFVSFPIETHTNNKLLTVIGDCEMRIFDSESKLWVLHRRIPISTVRPNRSVYDRRHPRYFHLHGVHRLLLRSQETLSMH